ncbi:MAG TPA: protein kinase [Chthoniobacterales bacterium]|nr:protein kinase [Chthoniobacterales bacterium]
MKHFSPGLSDSIACVIEDPPQCQHCDSSSHVAGGLCVGCLLKAGLDPDDECAPETLVSALAEVNLPDKNWRLGNYEILEEIGRGGMGVIYRARQRHSRRIVAVKRVLGYHADSHETLARFRREAQAAASLDHPNILPIHEVSESEDGLPFFSMKFASGGSLQEVGPALRNEPRQCVALVAKISRAVQYAHGKGILHRDLKPGNILLDGAGEPFVSDFGLAKWLDTTSDLTRTLTIFGTPGYIAPEQASGAAAQLKPAADIYSLGAILFDLLAGRPPFLGSHALSVIRQAAESPAPKLRSLSQIADRDLETICAHCLEREPSARYQTGHDLAEDLERWLEGRPILARPVSSPVKVWRWARRGPVLAGSLAACLVLLSAAVFRQLQNYEMKSRLREQTVARQSIGVLPFLDLDEAAADNETAASLGKALARTFENIGPAGVVFLRDIPNSFAGGGSAEDLRAAGKSGRTRTVLTGTTRRTAAGRRIVIRLMDAATGELLFSQPLKDDFLSGGDAQTILEAGKSIYSLLSAEEFKSVTAAAQDPGLANEQTRDLIIAGRDLAFRYNANDYDHAIICFEKAIAIEPSSAIAHAYLSAALSSRIHYANSPGFLERAEREARTALSLRPNLPEAHRAMAVIYQQRDPHRALEEHFRTIEYGGLDYRTAYVIGGAYQNFGRPDRALRWLELARRWEVRRGETDSRIGDCWADLADDSKAEESYSRAADLHPEMPYGWLGICRLKLLAGQFNDARQLWTKRLAPLRHFSEVQQMQAQIEFFARDFPRARELYSELKQADPAGGGLFYGSISYESAFDRMQTEAASPPALEALRARIETRRQVTPQTSDVLYQLAADESIAGEIDAAILHLSGALEAGWLDYRSALLDPRFDNIAKDSRFAAIISKAKAQIATLQATVFSRSKAQNIAFNSERR